METTLDPEDDELTKLRASLLYQESLVRINMGEISAAYDDINDSIELYEETEDEIGLTEAKLLLAKLLGYKMRYKEAITLFDECYTKFERIMYQPGIIDSLLQIAYFYLELDRKHLDTMEQNLVECESLCESIHYSFGLAMTYQHQAQYQFWQHENLEKALELYQRALTLFEEIGCINEMAYAYHYMGNLRTSDPRSLSGIGESKEYTEKSLELFESLGNRKGMAYAYLRLSHYPLFEGNFTEGEEFLHKSIDMYQKLGVRNIGYAFALHILSGIKRDQGAIEDAMQLYREILVIYENFGQVHNITWTFTDISDIFRLRGEFDKSLRYNMRALEMLGSRSGSVNDVARSVVLYRMVQLLVLHYPDKDAKPYLDQLEEIGAGKKPFWKEMFYCVAKAIYLNASQRVRDRYKAQEYLETVIQDDLIEHTIIGYSALLLQCELLLLEVQSSESQEVFVQLKQHVQRMYAIAQKHHLLMLLVEAQILWSKIAQIEGDFDTAASILGTAMEATTDTQLPYLIDKVKHEQQVLEDTYQSYSELIESNASMKERMEKLQLLEYIQKARGLTSHQ
jgi:tetratricopeptide (TPR) repeat protein